MKDFYKDVQVFNGKKLEITKIVKNKDDITFIEYQLSLLGDKVVGNALLSFSRCDAKRRKELERIGHKEIGDYCFELPFINIRENFRNQNFGSFLLNYIIVDVDNFNKDNNLNLPILTMKLLNNKNDDFYDRFDCELNDRRDSKEGGAVCLKIIAKPKIEYMGCEEIEK